MTPTPQLLDHKEATATIDEVMEVVEASWQTGVSEMSRLRLSEITSENGRPPRDG